MKYRKKPVEIIAFQYLGQPRDQWPEPWASEPVIEIDQTRPGLKIYTLEGVMRADVDDWIIKGVQGEFYPCKPKIFEQTYELVDQ